MSSNPQNKTTPAVADTITVKLVGADEDDGKVRFDDFREFCEGLSKCLRKSESILSAESPQVRYRIVGLASDSATLMLEPLPPAKGRDRRREILDFFQQTVSALEVGTAVDARVDYETVETFRELIAPLQRRRRAKEVWIGPARLTNQYEAHIKEILASSIPCEGSVAGVLEQVNVHRRNEFVLYPPIPGYRIRCTFPESMFDLVRRAIKRHVTVRGTLYFQPEKPFPHHARVTDMELHPPDSELPSLADLKGIAPDCTGGLDSVAFVRQLRDEQ